MADNFVNPYSFVAYNKAKVKKNINVEHRNLSSLHTGYLSCRVITKTPLAIPDTAARTLSDVDGHYNYPFMKINDKKTIPGSSIRGVIRSAYEAVTDSCMVTAREHSITARTSSSNAYKPGVLKYENGQWNLYPARRVPWVIKDRNHAPFNKNEKIDEFRNDYNGDPENTLEIDGETYRWGDRVFITEGDSYEKEKRFGNGLMTVWNSTVKTISHKKNSAHVTPGYVYIGECISNKHAESIFVISDSASSPIVSGIYSELKKLEETLDDYRNDKLNKKLGSEHHGYPGYENAKKNGIIPLWYKNKGGHLYLSLASVGRMAYENDFINLEGTPCNDRTQLCPACSLFGMISDIPGKGFGSRIRVSDAVIEVDKGRIEATLQELGGPKASYLAFYAKDAKEYDDDGSGIRGRKYYWHHSDAEKHPSEYQTMKSTERNSTMELQNPDSEFVFRVYYDGISEDQLQELEWVLTFGENTRNSSLCHKFGHGKPLGLGSAKVIIEQKYERTLDSGIYSISSSDISERIEPTKRISGSTGYKDMCIIADLNAISGEISYPYEGRKEDRENTKGSDNAALKWFKNNKPKKDNNHTLKVLPTVSEIRDGIHLNTITVNSGNNGGNSNRGGGYGYRRPVESMPWENRHPIKPRTKR